MGAWKQLLQQQMDDKRYRSTVSRYTAGKLSLPYQITMTGATEDGAFVDRASAEQYNAKVRAWGKNVTRDLRSSARGMLTKSSLLVPSIKPRFSRNKSGEIVIVGFSLRREGVYAHHGAGRGYGGEKGSKWIDRYGRSRETDPASLGKMGSGGRRARPWFNPVLAWHIEELADIAAEYSSKIVLDTTRIFINDK